MEFDEKYVRNLWHETNSAIKALGRNECTYQIIKNRTAFVIIDMQNAFCDTDGCIFIEDSKYLIKNINTLSKKCREENIPVFWIKHHVEKISDYGLWPKFQPKSPVGDNRERPINAFINSHKESEIFKDLIVSKKDIIVQKKRYSAFASNSSDLIKNLKKSNIKHLIFAGVGTNVCVESSVRDAMMLDFETTVLSDATASNNIFFHNISLMNIKLFFGDVKTTQEVIKEINNFHNI